MASAAEGHFRNVVQKAAYYLSIGSNRDPLGNWSEAERRAKRWLQLEFSEPSPLEHLGNFINNCTRKVGDSLPALPLERVYDRFGLDVASLPLDDRRVYA